MATKMAPTFANLYMVDLEESILRKTAWRFPAPLLWPCYIDDILLLWPGTEQQLLDFVTLLNSLWTPIQFTLSYDSSSLDFLDYTLYKGSRFSQSGILDLQPHYKRTNTFSHSHPPPPPRVFSGLVKGEMTRILYLSSDPTIYAHHINKLISNLSKRGYPKKMLNSKPLSIPTPSYTRPYTPPPESQSTTKTLFASSPPTTLLIQPRKPST